VFDLLYNNTSTIKPETFDRYARHESGQLLDSACLRYRFAPRYRDLHKKIDTLVGLHHRTTMPILLSNRHAKHSTRSSARSGPISSASWPRWRQKDVTQATIVRKFEQLCPPESDEESLVGTGESLPTLLHPRFYRPMWPYGRALQKALNPAAKAYHRVSAGHRLRECRQVSVNRSGTADLERVLALIANCGHLLHTALLSRVYEHKRAA